MKLVGLTGNIGSGKTTVLKFVRCGVVGGVDSDRIVAGLYRQEPVKKKLAKKFGTVKRKEIAKIVFSSAKKRKELEKILHPLAWKEIQKKTREFETSGKKMVVVEAPLLFEAGWQKKFDTTILIRAKKTKILARLSKRGMKKKEALQRLESQKPDSKKIKACQFVIDNNGPLKKTREQAKKILKKILEN